MSNYAEVLESYIISEEAMTQKTKENLKIAAVGVGAIASAAWLIHDAKRTKREIEEIKRQKERQAKEAEERKAREKREKEENEIRHRKTCIIFNVSKALTEAKLNLTAYPKDKFKDSSEIEAALKRDIRLALPKILATKEVSNAIEAYCNRFNSATAEEKENDFCLDEDTINPKWVKSTFKIGKSVDEGYFVSISLVDGPNDTRYYHVWTVASILDIIASYIDKKYINYGKSDSYYEWGWLHFDLN